MWRNMSTKGYYELYSTNNGIKTAYRRLKSLPFIKRQDTIKAFKLIKKEAPIEFEKFLNYFEEYYIGLLCDGSNSLRKRPMFPVELWNVYDLSLNDEPRTNNSLESWHKSFALDVKSHPDVTDLIRKFLDKQHEMEILYKQLSSGDFYPRKSTELAKDDLIKETIAKYSDETILSTLDKVDEIMRNNSSKVKKIN